MIDKDTLIEYHLANEKARYEAIRAITVAFRKVCITFLLCITVLACCYMYFVVPVEIVIDGTAYNLIKPCGNYVMSDQLRTQRFYPIRVGTNPNHFTIRCPGTLYGTAYVAPQLIPAEAATTGA